MKNAFLSFIYSCLQISYGLLIHPYQTMQSLVRERVFVWMTLLPMFFLGLVTVCWRFLLVPAVRLFFVCNRDGQDLCQFLPLIADWMTFFCLYWQILLFYLLFRFGQAFAESNKSV